MSLSRLSLLASFRRGLHVSPHRLNSSTHHGGPINWLCENYPVTLLASVVLVGASSICIYSAVCVLKNPDLYIPAYDRVPRDEFYFNKDYFGAHAPENSNVVPPVRMHYDGALELPYEHKKIHPPKKS